MANANDMSLLLNKIERRLGLLLLTPHLPEQFNKSSWANVIMTDTIFFFTYDIFILSLLCPAQADVSDPAY